MGLFKTSDIVYDSERQKENEPQYEDRIFGLLNYVTCRANYKNGHTTSK